ncbi:MAG: hypothetical protein EHM91_01600 [Planctomycetota bacterium]|nr:MAG: hypothetical protein EHM91_01600 [Planctomycetota bacterium]
MNDEELRKLLQNSLSGRRAPTEVRERIVSMLRPRRRLWIASAAAAALVVAVAIGTVVSPSRAVRFNPMIERAIEQHMQSPVFGHAASSATPREVAQTVSEASGRDIQIPGLRDGGFTQMQAHRCEATGWAHVIYANSWLKVSCFLLDSEGLDPSGGTPLAIPGIDAYSFAQDRFAVVVVRESGLAKIWVGDLRVQHLSSIAVDAELKRHQLQTTVLSVIDHGMAKQVGAMLQSIPGVEDIHMEPSKQEAYVKFDRRRVTPEEIYALLATNAFAASPRDWDNR